ncbi:hypothetical protein AALB39_01925 [Lachnospiraceae bacterium 54-53]
MWGIENNDIPRIPGEKGNKKTLTKGGKIAIVTLNILNIYDYYDIQKKERGKGF